MTDKLIKGELTNIKPYKTADGEWKLEALGAPFGGHKDWKDFDGEFFSPRTDFMMDVGDSRPVLYFHGDTAWGAPQARPEVIGKATLSRIDEKGLWFDIALDKTKKLAKRIWDSAIKGIVKASSGTVSYLKRWDKSTGEILSWAIGELTLVDEGQGRMASNQLATVSLKAIFEEAEIEMPQDFVQDTELSETESTDEVDAESKTPEVDAETDLLDKELFTDAMLVELGAKYLELLHELEDK